MLRLVILFVDDLGYNEINTGAHAPASGGYSGYGGDVMTPNIERLVEHSCHLLPMTDFPPRVRAQGKPLLGACSSMPVTDLVCHFSGWRQRV